jgi:hypothetical protein
MSKYMQVAINILLMIDIMDDMENVIGGDVMDFSNFFQNFSTLKVITSVLDLLIVWYVLYLLITPITFSISSIISIIRTRVIWTVRKMKKTCMSKHMQVAIFDMQVFFIFLTVHMTRVLMIDIMDDMENVIGGDVMDRVIWTVRKMKKTCMSKHMQVAIIIL